MAKEPERHAPSRPRAGPTDIEDPLLRQEAKRAAIWIGMVALVALVVVLAHPLLVIFGGMVFAAMIDGGARLLGRALRIGRGWRVAIVLLLAVAFLAWVSLFAGSQISQQAAELPATIETQSMRALEWLKVQGFAIDAPDLESIIEKSLGGLAEVSRAVGGIIGGFATLFLIAVLGIYFAAEPHLYQRGFAWMLPGDQRAYFQDTAQLMGKTLRRLLAGRLLGMFIEGIATWLMLQIYGVPMAALLGLLTGLLAFLPNIGAPISGLIMVLVGFSGGIEMGLYTIIVYLVVQTVDGNVIVPMIAKKTADLPPALVLGAQLIMGVLFGILGLALADPLVAMIKVWLERSAARREVPVAEALKAKKTESMARKFLYLVAVAVVLILALLFALRFWSEDLTEMTFVPDSAFTSPPPLADDAYAGMDMWISRPGKGEQDPARWLPEGAAKDAATLPAAVFFIHATSYLEKKGWNAPLDDSESRKIAELFVRDMASPFNASPDLWAPRYRQAAFGAFLTDAPEAGKALDAAYGDVLKAFDFFIATVNPKAPIVLVGHSQGAFLLRRLLRDRVAGTPLASRIAAAYAIGWPVSLGHDLPAMGLPACTAPDQPGCVLSWLSFAEPADTSMVLKAYARRPGLDGKPLGGSAFLCTNPLTGRLGSKADASANLGTLVPDAKGKTGMNTDKLVPAMVPARCGKDGLLYIGAPPELGPYVLPGNNYHVYDMMLFWSNLRKDVERRVKAWKP